MCTVPECKEVEVARGFCEKHYRRNLRHGSTEFTRSKDWGSREKHPLYSLYSWNRRSKSIGISAEWRKDFWLFVEEVGNRPTDRSRLLRIDTTKELSRDNYKWEEPKLTTKGTEGRNAYSRSHRALNPEIYKSIELKKHYGITLDQYKSMQQEQNDVCSICGNPEIDKDKRTDKIRDLAVDHNHATGKIRGLLCRGCNQGLGNFQEDLERLKAAVTYLEKHNEF